MSNVASATAPRSHALDSTPYALPLSADSVASAAREPDYDRVLAVNTPAPDLRHLLTTMHSTPARALAPLSPTTSSNPDAAKLDALERRFSGPYQIPGQGDVHALPMFHSNHPDNPQLAKQKTNSAFAQKACAKLLGALAHCTTARATPKELVAVTQALIDAGVLAARPGDVLHLDKSPLTENREHNVVIRQHDELTPGDPRWATLHTSEAGKTLAASGGPVHLLEIVCSGGGHDTSVRGVRREVWLYDEPTQRWGCIDPSTKQLTLYEHGPQNHATGRVLSARRGAP